MLDTDIAWLAGIIEGEGCIQIGRNGGVRVTVAMTDRDVIDRIESIFPGTGVRPKKPKLRSDGTPYKTQYIWIPRAPEGVREVLALTLPYFGERRAESARAVLRHLEERHIRNAPKTHCKQGHEFTPENTYQDPGSGYRNCRACRNRWGQESRARKPEGWRWRGAPRSCEFCGGEFRPSAADQRTCDRKCGARLRHREKSSALLALF